MHFIRLLWSKWKTIAHKIGVFQSKVILTIFYFTLFLPFGLVFTLFKDELRIKTRKKTSLLTKKKQSMAIEELKEQF